MKINKIPQHNDTRFTKVDIGDTFIYPTNGNGRVYLKIGQTGHGPETCGAVDLETGMIFEFPGCKGDPVVRKISTEVLIKN